MKCIKHDHSSAILFLILLVIGSVTPLVAAGQKTQESFEQEASESALEQLSKILHESDARRARIHQEIDELGHAHEWAGIYYQGDGLGLNIQFYIAPQTGFDYRWEGCLGLYDFDYGSVELRPPAIHLHPHRQHGETYQWVVADPYRSIHWGKRHYLIPENQFIDFCNAINAHDEPRTQRHGDFFLREGDEAISVQGFPDLPEPYHGYILSDSLTVSVLDIVGETEVDEMPATLLIIDAGGTDGVYIGMRLYVLHRKSVQWLDILHVDEQTATGAVFHFFDEYYPRPEKGWEFSTLPEWNRE